MRQLSHIEARLKFKAADSTLKPKFGEYNIHYAMIMIIFENVIRINATGAT